MCTSLSHRVTYVFNTLPFSDLWATNRKMSMTKGWIPFQRIVSPILRQSDAYRIVSVRMRFAWHDCISLMRAITFCYCRDRASGVHERKANTGGLPVHKIGRNELWPNNSRNQLCNASSGQRWHAHNPCNPDPGTQTAGFCKLSSFQLARPAPCRARFQKSATKIRDEATRRSVCFTSLLHFFLLSLSLSFFLFFFFFCQEEASNCWILKLQSLSMKGEMKFLFIFSGSLVNARSERFGGSIIIGKIISRANAFLTCKCIPQFLDV